MAQKKALTDEELLAQFESIGATDAAPPASSSTPSKSSSKPSKQAALENDPLAELENLAKAKPLSRPNTPKLGVNRTRSPVRRDAHTPPSSGSGRNSEDKPRALGLPRKSGESARSFHQGLTPAPEESADENRAPEQQGGGGWWGGIFATASAAVKQAEAAVKEIQKNEEAQKWAQQVRGNVGALRGLGGELRSRALPSFTDILHTIAPPISQHERLQIHITHDLVGYPSLDPTIYAIFSRVMSQVEGGDLLVIQRGSESRGTSGSKSGWSDGPWWRDSLTKRDIGIVKGLTEGTKLVRVSAEAYANEYFASRGGLEQAIIQANENLSESNPVRSSDIFLAIQAIEFEAEAVLFQGAAEEKEAGGVVDEKENDELVAFAVYLHDPVHAITFHAVSQALPRKWIDWLDAENVLGTEMQLPDEIADIVQSGGIDPREWVSEWIEETISLSIGVIAQRYVAKRMGVGEGGLGKGKARQEVVEAGAGEAARAI